MKEKKLINAAVIICWLPVLCYALGQYKLVSISLYCSVIIIWFIFGFKILCKKALSRRWYFILIFATAFVSIVLSKSINYTADRKIRNVIYLCTLLIIFYVVEYLKINFNENKIIFQIPTILTIIFGIIALSRNSYDLGNYHNALYLNYQNPNVLANVLLIMLIYQCLGKMKFKKWYYTLSIFLTILLIYLTRSRSAFLAGMFFLIIFVINPFYYKINSLFNFTVINIPLYIVIFSNILNYILSIKLLGKQTGLSGRNIIWGHILRFIFSNGSCFISGINDSLISINELNITNCHNAYLQIAWVMGVPFFLLFIIALWTIMEKSKNKVKNKFSFIAYMGIAILLLNNSLESNLADGIIGMAFLTFLLVTLVNSEEKDILIYAVK